jgi:capsular exopolysaccharide synthesis family protein
VLGLLLGVGLAVLRETLDTTIKSVDEVNAITDAGVLGSVRFDSDAVKRPLVTDLESHAARVEAFRVLRTNLQYVDVDRPSKVVVMTSSLPNEGKTTTAINLAITLAQAGQRICLLEADLRRPKVSDYLRLEPSVGLTTALIGKLPITEAVQSWGTGLAVITSGSVPPNPSELLQSDAMRDVLDELRKVFDVIIVDSPPLLPVTDAAIISAQADGALLVVRHGKTTRDQLRGAVERLKSVDARVVGAVLSMTKAARATDTGTAMATDTATRLSRNAGSPASPQRWLPTRRCSHATAPRADPQGSARGWRLRSVPWSVVSLNG